VIEDVVKMLPVEELIARARRLAVPGMRHILGITGAPGAGKSTLAEQIVQALGPELAVLVPMDGFHLANEVLLSLGRRDRKGAYDTFDDSGYAALLGIIRHQMQSSHDQGGYTIYAPRFRRDIEEPIASSIPIRSNTPLVVSEGNYLLLDIGSWPKARECIDEVWYLYPTEESRHERLVLRHEAYGKSPEEAERWTRGSDQRNAELIESTAHRADLIVRIA
jgi:pantothenate kinase